MEPCEVHCHVGKLGSLYPSPSEDAAADGHGHGGDAGDDDAGGGGKEENARIFSPSRIGSLG